MTARSNSTFPKVVWGNKSVAFIPADNEGVEAPIKAAIVFALRDDLFVLADIEGRGWCIPGGRLEAGEMPEDAVRREAWEEAGATLSGLRLLGWFLLDPEAENTSECVPAYVTRVTKLVPLPEGTESRGIRMTGLAELPDVYYMWDGLLAAVFDYAFLQCPNG